MKLDLVNIIVNDAKKNKYIQSFIKELQNNLDNNISKNNIIYTEKEDIPLINPTHNEDKIIAKYRDKMLVERAHILSNYAQQTLNKGEMYYIYSKNSKFADGYNMCICGEEKSHTIKEKSKENLPNGARVGSVLRKVGNNYLLDEDATEEIEKEIYAMKSRILKEQTEFLRTKRIEGHIYEISEKDSDRAWLFDITNKSNEGIEEIDFPTELLKHSKEGDLFIYNNGQYQKY